MITAYSLTACRRTQPQIPSNKGEAVDSTRIAYVLMTRQLAEEADRTVLDYIKRQKEPFTLTESGYWLQYRPATNHDTPVHLNNEVHIRRRCRDLSTGALLEDTEETILPEHTETIPAIQDVLSLMHENDSALLIVPWYMGYGATGGNGVPPYTNLIVELIIL